MVRRWEWEGNGRGRGVGEGYGVGDSRKLRRLYIFLGDFCVSQFDFVLMSDFFLRGWNVSIGMNALRPHFYMKRGGKKRREKKNRERRLTLHSLVGANLLDSSRRHVVAVLLLLVLVGVDAEESYSCLRNRAASQ